jgi:hypothetical protein
VAGGFRRGIRKKTQFDYSVPDRMSVHFLTGNQEDW